MKEQTLKAVAENCYGYDSLDTAYKSNLSGSESISCRSCRNFVGNKCKKDLFDKVRASIR